MQSLKMLLDVINDCASVATNGRQHSMQQLHKHTRTR